VARRVETTGDGAILYDDALISQPAPALFEAAHWPGASLAPAGRGATLFVEHAGQSWAVRHYRRGGLVGRILDDQFLWTGQRRTRAFREWSLLAELLALGLPVPRPVAARYQRRGLIYTADLITLRLPDVEPLPARLAAGAGGSELWRSVGSCIARFHARGIWHADLSANNVQVDSRGRVFLLDFDRGRQRRPQPAWQQQNLKRLHRSLAKLRARDGIPFAAADWAVLLAAYQAGSGSGG